MGRTSSWLTAYSDFLLGEYDSAVLSPNANGGDIGGSDGLESILCGPGSVSSYDDGMSSAIIASLGIMKRSNVRTDLIQSTLVGEDSDVSIVACAS